MTDWNSVQELMLALEALGDSNPDVLTTITKILNLPMDEKDDLHKILLIETERAINLFEGFYIEHAHRTRQNEAAICFMQGITFARALELVRAEERKDAA